MSAAGRMLVMAAGTGGHIYPALAVAKSWQQQGGEVVWLGTPGGMESRLIPQEGIRLETIAIGGLRGKGPATLLLAPLRLLRALIQAIGVVRRVQPDVVLGMGGFVAGPGGLAAWLMRVPLVIHEQNAIAGLTNRVLSRLAKMVLEAFPGTFTAHSKVVCTGNPVRKQLYRVEAAEPHRPLRLLVLGGSLGAKRINELVPEMAATLGDTVALYHQTGQHNFDETTVLYRQQGVEVDGDLVRVVPYIEEMESAYGWADLVLCRAGAMTISELMLVGRGAILSPFPHAVDDHQTANGQYLQQAGAALLIQQCDLTVQRLVEVISELMKQPQKVVEMGRAARGPGKPKATEMVVSLCRQWSEQV